MIVNNLYTSVACNRTPNAADWSDDNLIYFAACNSVAIFDPNHNGSSKITKTLNGHKARVNTVKRIKNCETQEIDVISGSDDATCILWNSKDQLDPIKYVLQGHTSGVTVADAIYKNNQLTIATASADSSIKLWKNSECFQTICLNGFCFALKFFELPRSGNLMLALTTYDDFIHLYMQTFSEDSNSYQFVAVEKLAGHEDWVRGLDVITDNGDILLASSSQDTFIRLWRISPRDDNIRPMKAVEDLAADEDIQIEERIFSVVSDKKKTFYYALSLESVLQGHEGWVYSVNFCRKSDSKLLLLSGSIDKSLIIWSASESGVWFEDVRVGEVGGSSLGFYGGKFSPDARSIVGHGFLGSFHIWNQAENDLSFWNPGIIIGGHFAEVRDIAWEPQGQFLYSLSADQTTRIHSAWSKAGTWHEIARPQVHGYDMQCMCVLSRYKFASGAEEKIVRVFQSPGNFVENFRQLSGIEVDDEGESILESNPKGASVPSLGLSNKAVFNCDEVESDKKHVKDIYPESYFTPVSLSEPPSEETLMQNTLWPEVQKLYGHGFEIYSLTATTDGSLVASSCKATVAEHAQILLWDTSTWKIIQKLPSHQLTVTQLKFSPDNRFLLSVSRDRRLSLFENKPEVGFELVATTDKKNGVHSRIIWCCDWSHDSKLFATGSRDGKAVIWQKSAQDSKSSLGFYAHSDVLELKGDSITAVAFAHRKLDENNHLVALGLESGIIHLYSFDGKWKHRHTINQTFSHHLTVKRLAFRPNVDSFQLASCGEDYLVRIYDIKV